MQSTTRLHDGIAHAVLQEAYPVFHDPLAFHTANRVFDTDSNRRDHAIVGFRGWGEFTPTWLFLGLNHRDPIQHKALEPHILIEGTPVGQGIIGQLREAFVLCLAFHRVTQEAHATGLLDHDEGLDRVALLLTAVVFPLFLGIGGAVDRSLRAIRPTRGGRGTPAGRLAASSTANASALRAGSNS
jgi:hypothetical protein